jgi:ribonuclease HII
VSLVSASHIDKYGISHAIRKGIEDGLKKLALNPETARILLDGSLKAPEIFTDQETIIKGDAKEKIIGLASIMAKVTRDRYMAQVAKKYPKYEFEIHKGYGTRKHCDAIERHGISALHRKSFCKRFLS